MVAGPHASRLWRFVALVAALAAAASLMWILGPPDLAAAREAVVSMGPAGPVMAVMAIAAGLVVLVPRTAMSIATGVLFGWMPAFGVVVAGSLLGATAGFGLGRLLGREFVAGVLAKWSQVEVTGQCGWRVRLLRWVERGLARADAWLAGHGVVGIWIARLIPVSHFGFLSYVSGTSSVRYRHFLIGTLIGCVPGSLGYTAVGGAVMVPGGVVLALGLAIGLNVMSLTTWALINRALAKRAASSAT